MAWEDNRNKSIREISKEERLQWLRAQIRQMEMAKPQPTRPVDVMRRCGVRVRRDGKWVE